MEEGKLNWRLEWPAVWKVLEVDVEPYGKDHATPGGSRDSCVEIATSILGISPPFGIANEFVGYGEQGVDKGEMGSSGFNGITPRQWLDYAEPELLRFLYFSVPIRRRLLIDLSKLDTYHDQYDLAERAYYQSEPGAPPEDSSYGYKCAQFDEPGSKLPFQLPFRHAALLSQVYRGPGILERAVDRMTDSGFLGRSLEPLERDHVSRRLKHADRWVADIASDYRVTILQRIPEEVQTRIGPEMWKALRELGDVLSVLSWDEGTIKQAMVGLTAKGKLGIPTEEFFRALYLVFLGTEKGPRAAPLLSVLDRAFVVGRLRGDVLQEEKRK